MDLLSSLVISFSLSLRPLAFMSGVTKKLHIPTARNDEQIDAYRRPTGDSIQNQDLGDLGQYL